MHFLSLPRSLVTAALFVLTATAVPVSSLELTPDNFDQNVSKGHWFIEHFSPWCPHCKHFKPTWEQLVAEAKTEIPTVNMGTVDCTVYGDLCDKNQIKGYPTLLMFEDGKIVDQFKGSRELDSLKEFMKRYVKEEVVTPPPPPPPPVKVKEPPKSILNTEGEVLPLTADTFSSTLAKGPAFVKFFAPWCGHCKKLAPTWKQLARHMQNKVTVAEVNCDDHSSLCKAQDVQGYPTLVWYAQGDDPAGKTEYTSGRKLDQLKDFAEKASAAGVTVLEKLDELDKHVEESDVVYLLLHPSSDPSIVDVVRQASAPLLGSPQVYASSDPSLFSHFTIPASSPWALVALKDHDEKLPSSIFHGSSSSTSSSDPELRRWLLTHRLPTSLELTTDTFQKVMNAPQAPLVVIAAAPEAMREKVMTRLRDVGKKWRVRTDGSGLAHGREVVFAWMDASKWGSWMKSMYDIKVDSDDGKDGDDDDLDDVPVVIADHNKLIYYDTDRSGNHIKFTSSVSLFSAVDDASAGKTKSKNSEGFIERVARYLNNKMQTVEHFVANRPFQTLFIVIGFLAAVFWILTRLVNSDVAFTQQPTQEEWRQYKGKSGGRLD
ncbi:protein disulfide isomerase [Agrocybe pediades]|nr:protein disulfide isomerase [Agrocybe pediades]